MKTNIEDFFDMLLVATMSACVVAMIVLFAFAIDTVRMTQAFP